VALLAATRPAGAMLPKAEDPAPFSHLQSACPGLLALPLVESAAGMLGALAVAQAPGVQRLVFGTLDYALDLELLHEARALEAGHAHLALVSRAAGLGAPVAGVTVAIDDDDALRADWAQARSHGFGAKLCIHPRQLAPLHAAMAPAEADLAWARRVLQAAAHSPAGAVQLDGRMIDRPVVERARRLIDRAAG
jgi:citrate lyase subunit beta/citryl-CoA lyase